MYAHMRNALLLTSKSVEWGGRKSSLLLVSKSRRTETEEGSSLLHEVNGVEGRVPPCWAACSSGRRYQIKVFKKSMGILLTPTPRQFPLPFLAEPQLHHIEMGKRTTRRFSPYVEMVYDRAFALPASTVIMNVTMPLLPCLTCRALLSLSVNALSQLLNNGNTITAKLV